MLLTSILNLASFSCCACVPRSSRTCFFSPAPAPALFSAGVAEIPSTFAPFLSCSCSPALFSARSAEIPERDTRASAPSLLLHLLLSSQRWSPRSSSTCSLSPAPAAALSSQLGSPRSRALLLSSSLAPTLLLSEVRREPQQPISVQNAVQDNPIEEISSHRWRSHQQETEEIRNFARPDGWHTSG